MARIRSLFENLLLGAITLLSLMGATLMIKASSLWSQEAAGWAQAIGSVVAIAVAIWISHSDARIRQKNEDAIAIIAASNSLHDVHKLRYAVHQAITDLSKENNGWINGSDIESAKSKLRLRPIFTTETITQLAPLRDNCAVTLAKIQSAIGNAALVLDEIEYYQMPREVRGVYGPPGVDNTYIQAPRGVLERQREQLMVVMQIMKSAGH